MATKSILKTVCIRNKKSIEKLVGALEQAERQHTAEQYAAKNTLNPTIKEMDIDTIKKIWGNA